MLLINITNCLMISLALLLLSLITMKKSISNSSFPSPFECGFDPKYKTRHPLSLQFFLISLTFLMFDTELIIILPLPLSSSLNLSMSLISSITLLPLLILGVFYEKSMGLLSWLK
uniref:NADH-ubiquinone oxidoreductase chain 3 n=1 Tax=Armillifer agkistrodontis TaxID=592791 RepID=A0A1J0CYI5_ARMAG|nr:NADH dehydrogenase subunit 3 [Armillifer agkistrodontis]APB92071.1 NADH dehydrogenase subunit 3 [Armillifer agkistrodontis]